MKEEILKGYNKSFINLAFNILIKVLVQKIYKSPDIITYQQLKNN